jgi:hypothetical protein
MVTPTFWKTLFLLQLGASSLSQAQPTIVWSECPKAVTDLNNVPSECGTLAVPLDYTDSGSVKKLNLKLVKVKAAVQPSRGSILINPGGPGIGGAEYLSGRDAAIILRYIFENHGELDGTNIEQHDWWAVRSRWIRLQVSSQTQQNYITLTSWRGTGETLPVKCYHRESIYDQFEQFKAISMTPPLTNASSSALGIIWATSGAIARRCFKEAHDTLPFVSTAFTARDFIQIVDALDEDGMLRYWGKSRIAHSTATEDKSIDHWYRSLLRHSTRRDYSRNVPGAHRQNGHRRRNQPT